MDATGLFFYLVSFLIAGGIYAILCIALNIQWGMGGLFNAGIAGFFAASAPGFCEQPAVTAQTNASDNFQ